VCPGMPPADGDRGRKGKSDRIGTCARVLPVRPLRLLIDDKHVSRSRARVDIVQNWT
jgi:hypothetical protein